MAWPPTIPPNPNNLTTQLDRHPSDHTAINVALADIRDRVNIALPFACAYTAFGTPPTAASNNSVNWSVTRLSQSPVWRDPADSSRIIVPDTGAYLVISQLVYQNVGSGTRIRNILNATNNPVTPADSTIGAGGQGAVSNSAVFVMNAGAVITVSSWSGSPGSLVADATTLYVQRVG